MSEISERELIRRYRVSTFGFAFAIFSLCFALWAKFSDDQERSPSAHPQIHCSESAENRP